MLTSYILRLIRKIGPAIYWIIMISYAVLKFANEVFFYPCRTKTMNIATN